MQPGPHQTAWAMPHRYRSVLVRPGRDQLTGDVQAHETFLGGPQPGVPGPGELGQVLFAAAVELNRPRGLGRARPGAIQDVSAVSRRQFVLANAEPGRRNTTDG